MGIREAMQITRDTLAAKLAEAEATLAEQEEAVKLVDAARADVETCTREIAEIDEVLSKLSAKNAKVRSRKPATELTKARMAAGQLKRRNLPVPHELHQRIAQLEELEKAAQVNGAVHGHGSHA